MGKVEQRFWDHISDIYLFILVVLVCIIFITLAATLSTIVTDREEVDVSCYHPFTPSTRIFVGACLDEGYSFSQCYEKYVDAVEHGSVLLEMPVVVT